VLRRTNEKSSCFFIRAIRGAFAVRSNKCSSCYYQHVSGDELRSVHELHHLIVLLLSVPRHVAGLDLYLSGSRVLRRNLR
jgi:hypothetical protein